MAKSAHCVPILSQATTPLPQQPLRSGFALRAAFASLRKPNQLLTRRLSISRFSRRPWQDCRLRESNLPKEKMSQSDKRKLNQLTILVRQRAKEFGFSTFDPTEVTISEDTYRPQKEGFEIGFETSASDAIRLKWAYQLGLLELGTMEATNHPGTLLFDEPRQQSSARASFESLLKRAAAVKQHNQQVIFSTSEDLQNLQRATAGLDCERRIFSGYMIQPVV